MDDAENRRQYCLFPDFIKGMGSRNFPEMAKTFLSEQVKPLYKPANGQAPKMRVGYFYGGATDVVSSRVGLKFIDFLTKHGVEVVVPEQSCCGRGHLHERGPRNRADASRSNVKAFDERRLHRDRMRHVQLHPEGLPEVSPGQRRAAEENMRPSSIRSRILRNS